MKLDRLKKRVTALEPDGSICPCCRALEELTDKELDVQIAALESGHGELMLPEPSPKCPICQKAAAMSEEELDAELAKLDGILQDAIG